MGKKLQCKVPAELDAVIKKVQRRAGTKGKALNRLLRQALEDNLKFISDGKLGNLDTKSCTLDVSLEFYEKGTLKYRDLHDLTSATAFFRLALEHGATLYLVQNPEDANPVTSVPLAEVSTNAEST